MNDCKHFDIDNSICILDGVKCYYTYQEIKEGDCSDYESIENKESVDDKKFHEIREK